MCSLQSGKREWPKLIQLWHHLDTKHVRLLAKHVNFFSTNVPKLAPETSQSCIMLNSSQPKHHIIHYSFLKWANPTIIVKIVHSSCKIYCLEMKKVNKCSTM